jgi:hypothetical protein
MSEEAIGLREYLRRLWSWFEERFFKRIKKPVIEEKIVSTNESGLYTESVKPGHKVLSVYALSPDVIVSFSVYENILTVKTFASETEFDERYFLTKDSKLIHYHKLKPVSVKIKIIYLVS